MKKRISFVFLFIGLFTLSQAEESFVIGKDTISKSYSLNEISVTGIKEQTTLQKVPASVSIIDSKEINEREILSPNDLTSIVPNFYMPDYGSKITSSIFIRGIGSRMNEPAVGLYVDNVPYLDKSTFDFDYYDLASIEVLRGPQGTLYGRNSMGGIINVNTISPLSYQGTKIVASYGNENTIRANITHYEKMNEKMGISLGANYNQTDGFFTNIYTGEKADKLKSGGGRIRFDWNISDRWRMNYALSYEYSDQNGFPYAAYDKATGNVADVNYNDPGSYKRSLMMNSLFFRYLGNKFEMNSTTSYQYFDDEMLLDQDFTPENIFTLDQKQNQKAFTEEVIFKSKNQNNYQWLFGAFGFYQNLKTDVPVEFKQYGMNQIFAGIKEKNPNAPLLTLMSDSVLVDGTYKTPRYGGAIFHQSTFNNLLTKGLSLTLGLRLDYEKVKLNYSSNTSYADVTAKVTTPRGEMIVPAPIAADTISGKESTNFTELLPKIALRYEFDDNSMIYASIAKGYKAGGYNIQLFGDIMQNRMMTSTSQTGRYPSQDKINEFVAYKPEYSWNYEIGGRTSFIKNQLFADASLFYIDCRDMQFVQSSETMGRIMKNAGKVASYGAEISLSGIFNKFRANVAYGFTHATFKQYTDSIKNPDGTYSQVDYKGNYSPMAPKHTLSVAADYTFSFVNSFIDKLIIGAQYTGAGKIYWTVANDASQDFYGLLNGKISLVKGICQLDVWTKNTLDTDYETFYFETMGNSFVQKGKPFQIGVNFMVKF